MVIGCHQNLGVLNCCLGSFPQDDSIFDDCFTIDTCKHEVYESNNHHAFQSGVDRMLEDVEVTVVLRPPFDVSLCVEPVGCFDVYLACGFTADDLIGSTHLKEASTCVVVTVIDSFDDSFYLWSLNEIKNLKFDCDLEGVSSRKILLENDGGQIVLVIDCLHIFDDHDSDVLHQLPTEEAQTKELLRQKVQKFIQQGHIQQGISGVTEKIALKAGVEKLHVHDVEEVFYAVEIEDGQKSLRQIELRFQEFIKLIALNMSVDGLHIFSKDLLFVSVL